GDAREQGEAANEEREVELRQGHRGATLDCGGGSGDCGSPRNTVTIGIARWTGVLGARPVRPRLNSGGGLDAAPRSPSAAGPAPRCATGPPAVARGDAARRVRATGRA